MFDIGNITFLTVEDENLKNEIYKLRYKVYVEEFGFEKKENHPDGMEKDIYDQSSIHFAGINKETNEVIATMRIILHSEIGFPLEHLEDVSFKGDKKDLDKIIEVSRFAVDARYRRRKEDILFKGIDIDKDQFDRRKNKRDAPDRRQKPVVVYGLFRLLYQTTKKLGVRNWCMISENFLFTALTNMGFIFYPIGREVDYHGLRTPYIAFIDEMEETWIQRQKEFILFLADGLEERYWPKLDAFANLIGQYLSQPSLCAA